MAKVNVPDTNMKQGASPGFEGLMRQYQNTSTRMEAAKADVKDTEGQLKHLKNLIRQEVLNMGLAKGSSLKIEGVGTFHFTSKKYWGVPSGDDREALVQVMLGEENGAALLTVGKKDLNDWCRDREDREVPVPHYLKHFEDANVPVISLKKAPK